MRHFKMHALLLRVLGRYKEKEKTAENHDIDNVRVSSVQSMHWYKPSTTEREKTENFLCSPFISMSIGYELHSLFVGISCVMAYLLDYICI